MSKSIANLDPFEDPNPYPFLSLFWRHPSQTFTHFSDLHLASPVVSIWRQIFAGASPAVLKWWPNFARSFDFDAGASWLFDLKQKLRRSCWRVAGPSPELILSSHLFTYIPFVIKINKFGVKNGFFHWTSTLPNWEFRQFFASIGKKRGWDRRCLVLVVWL